MPMPFALLVSLILLTGLAHGQIIGSQEIDESHVSVWTAASPLEYQYVYHFGDSKMESDLVLLYDGEGWHAQIKSGQWHETRETWVTLYENLTNVRVEGTHFFSDQTGGSFVAYHEGEKKLYGLKINTPWGGWGGEDQYEIGLRSYPVATYFNGRFTQASTRILRLEELRSLPKADLQIMRNEIFARYGYRFKAGGKMEAYFNTQKWYTPQHDNVNMFLTALERKNIASIRQVEKE